jgi:hypothetical protein
MPLAVGIERVEAHHAHAGIIAVAVSVAGGRGAIRLSLHLDGDLVGRWHAGTGVYEIHSRGRLRRVLTVRAVDDAGAWGAASTVLTPASAACQDDGRHGWEMANYSA